MMSDNIIDIFFEKGNEQKYSEAVEYFDRLNEAEKANETVMLAYADYLYELGNDLSALSSYLHLVEQHPNGKTVNVALFGAAMTLKNMDLQDEALRVLLLIDSCHEGLEKELAHSSLILDKQTKAKDVLRKYENAITRKADHL